MEINQKFKPITIKYSEQLLLQHFNKTDRQWIIDNKGKLPSYITSRVWIYFLTDYLSSIKGALIAYKSTFKDYIFVDDELTFYGNISDVWEKKGKRFFTLDYYGMNQNKDIIVKHRMTAMELVKTER